MTIRFLAVQCASCGRIFELEERDIAASTKRPDGKPYVYCAVCLTTSHPPRKGVNSKQPV